MGKRHNYEYEVDTTSQTAPANVVRLVGKDKRVLEIGCGPGSITRILAENNACKVTGVELDPQAIKMVTPYCVKVIQADLNSSEWPRLLDDSEKFDVVVAADVLEHLYDPWSSLQRMVTLINDNGYIVISLPHIGHAAVLSCLINGDFEYRDWGLLDRTHIRFFGLKNIENLFAQAGLKIIEARYVTKLPEETEFAATWAKISSSEQKVLMNSKYAQIYQVVVKAVPNSYSNNAILLTPPMLEYKRLLSPNFSSFKSRLSPFLSAEFKAKARKLLNLIGLK
jgi:2-polyprenyl-3-methyl-5-hydroxy-6-metoxy-1,4-benzoquinol methylase